jgi:hypothetical protein
MRSTKINPPRLHPIEQTLVVLMSRPNKWVVVDVWEHKPLAAPSNRHAYVSLTALVAALRRRGAETRVKRFGSVIVAKARWTHPVPVDVPEFEGLRPKDSTIDEWLEEDGRLE